MKSLFKDTLQSIAKNPWQLMIWQLPAASVGPLTDTLESLWSEDPTLIAIICFPYFCFASILSTAGCFHIVQSQKRDEIPTLKGTFQEIISRWRMLVPASLAVGLLTLLGLVALIIPGIYIATIYLFVPHLIMSEPKKPVLSYLQHSKQIAKHRLWITLFAVVIFFALSFWGHLAADWAIEAMQIASSLGPLFKIFDAVLIGTLIDVGVTHYFFMLRVQGEKK